MEQLSASPPSAWVARFTAAITPGARVLDVAGGNGRHSRFLLAKGFRVTAVDRDIGGLASIPGLEVVGADLENGAPWPFLGRGFAAIVVTNYLHRPLFPHLVASLVTGGILIYETFQQGNERFGRPSNPDFLLAPGELLRVAEAQRLTVLGYFSGYTTIPRPAVIQRIAARQGTS
ncbi:tellurite resistance protein TehB [Dongia mobilis]|uniref:Tellurite resistance protein TehB n=1 Tax=Dongia mobilis TaxID=578943 RepID=A0A4R6WJN4_9PROT|nr:class I SAM-dependent methyltransferase [Dongia mobilis]TDQ78838.1 tellurite resistance protein TehB [Dongia mobilis]